MKSVCLESDTEDGRTNDMTKHSLLEIHLNVDNEYISVGTAKNKVLSCDEK